MNELDELLSLEKFDSYVQVGKGIGLVFNKASKNKSEEIRRKKGMPNVNMMMINEIRHLYYRYIKREALKEEM